MSVARVVRLGHDAAHFLVDLARHQLAVVALLADAAAQEDHLLALAEDHRAHLLAHAVLRDHGPGQLGDLVQVIHGAVGHVAKDHLFGHAAAQHGAMSSSNLALLTSTRSSSGSDIV